MKAFDLSGLRALVSQIAHAQRTADASAASLEELSRVKQDRPSMLSISIPAEGWETDAVPDYGCYVDIAVPALSAQDRATVVLAPASLAAAAECGLCPVCETLMENLRIRARRIPAAALSAVCWIEKGA